MSLVIDYFYATVTVTYILLLLLLLFLRWSFAVSLRLEYGGAILTHCNPHLTGLSDSPASASQVVGIIGARHYTWLIFLYF